MEQQMNCFQWQNHASDYLDDTLSETDKHRADEHLETCKDCSERLKHYRQIITAIANQTRSSLPSIIKKAPLALPLSPTLSRGEFGFLNLTRWQKVPWYVRTLLEGATTVILITISISSAPRLKDWYEKNFGRNMTDLKYNLLPAGDGEETDLVVPPVQTKATAHPTRDPSSKNDELAGENENDPEENHKAIRIGSSQLWRFTIKTVSPDELRPKVILALRKLHIPDDTPGLGGNQVPGGIEFDLVLAQSMVSEIKHTLEKLAPESVAEPGDTHSKNTSSGPETFSWYKVKSKRKIPDGKSQVVIWLSQP